MRKLIVSTFLTLDGVMQAPGGPGEDDSDGFALGGWSVNYWDDQMGEIIGEAMSAPFDLLLGRRTYDIFSAYWPHATDNPGAKPLNDATKYVASRSHRELEWGPSVLIEGDAAEGIAALKKEDGPELQVHGSARKRCLSDVTSLIAAGRPGCIRGMLTGGICEPGVIVMLGGIPPFAGEIAGFLAACVTCAVQDAIKATAPIAAVARSVTSRLTRSSCAPEGCLRKLARQTRPLAHTGPTGRAWPRASPMGGRANSIGSCLFKVSTRPARPPGPASRPSSMRPRTGSRALISRAGR